MFKTLGKAIKNRDIRKKLLFTLFILVVVRIGALVPIPGVDTEYFSTLISGLSEGNLSFLSAFTGGSFERMSLFALSITPYITAQIIVQLLTIAIPAWEEMQKEGEDGRKRLAKITRYLSVILSLVESIAMAVGFGRQGLILNKATMSYMHYAVVLIVVIAALTAGATIQMWLGERITEHGVGNGISMILLFNIISGMPEDFAGLFEKFVFGKSIPYAVLSAAVIIGIVIAMTFMVVILQDAERRIPVQYSGKMAGRKTYGGSSSNIPLKVNTAGVMPIIFASSLMQFPVIIAQLTGHSNSNWVRFLSSGYWARPAYPIYSLGFIVYMLLCIVFAYFYTSITFNPIEVADNLRRSGGVIPGITPGKATSDYLQRILNSIIFIGVIGLIIVAAIPIVLSGIFDASVSFGGTSIIIIVGVVLETINQIKSMMYTKTYKGFLQF